MEIAKRKFDSDIFLDINLFKILCADHFDNSIDKYTKIDLKSITQNSPLMAGIEAGYSIYALHKDQKRKQELHALEIRNTEFRGRFRIKRTREN